MNRLFLPAAVLGVTLVAGCAYQAGPNRPYQEQRSPAAMAELDRALSGKIPGRPQSCLSHFEADDMKVIDDYTILYRHGSTTYRNEPIGGCPGLGSPGNAMVTRSISTDLCRGDIVQVVDTQSGINHGSCALGDFVPFRTPGR